MVSRQDPIDLYLGSGEHKSQQGYTGSPVEVFVVFLSPSRHMPQLISSKLFPFHHHSFVILQSDAVSLDAENTIK
jgi:hypothetical protein